MAPTTVSSYMSTPSFRSRADVDQAGSKTYFDTNSSEHHHFYVEGDSNLFDIPGAELLVDKLPTPPEGYEVARVDVVVRLRRTGNT